MHTFTIEAYYEDGAVQARTEIEAPDAITALNRVGQFTWARGISANSLNPHMKIATDDGALVPVYDVIAAMTMVRAA